jgi:aspartate racemase
MNYQDVAESVDIPVLDIRDAIAQELRELGTDSLSLLGTKYLMENEFFSSHLERLGIRVARPVQGQVDELQRMIFEELTQGFVSETSKDTFMKIADHRRSRGGEVAGLCCTEFGMFFIGKRNLGVSSARLRRA